MFLVVHGDDFGCNVAGSAATVEVIGFLLADGCQSEVYQHWLPCVGPEHHVLQLDVPVHDSKPVHVSQGLEQSSHDLLALLLSDASLSVDPLEEVAPAEVLSDHVEGGLGVHNADDLYDVGVVQHSENLYFVHYALSLLRLVRKAALREHLGREDLPISQPAY